MKTFIIILLTVFTAVAGANTREQVIKIYGPGGPYPVINEAAQKFGSEHHVHIEVIKGPSSRWMDRAKTDADLIYSGAEFMMTNFIRQMDENIDQSTVCPLYLRRSGLLVRPGNPTHISGFKDILRPGIKIMVVNGAGQTALWEGMAGKQGDIETVRQLRKNIVYFAPNSGNAKSYWINHPNIDVWLIWNIWQVSNPAIATFVPVSNNYVLYRDCGIALTHQGKSKKTAMEFYRYLQGQEAAAIFKKWGWMTNSK